MAAAARRAAAAHLEMLNEKATIMQNSWRAHLWDLLMKAAIINNRSRRIQRGFRAHQYNAWIYIRVQLRRTRMATRLQRGIRLHNMRVSLARRFKYRKALLLFTRCKKTISTIVIQRCYRAHVAWLLWVKEQLMAFYAAQRANAGAALDSVSIVQKFWRKYHRLKFRDEDKKIVEKGWKLQTSWYSEHVLLLFKNELRRMRWKLYRMAVRIQALIRNYIVKRRARMVRWRKSNANKIWAFTKSYLLKLALFDLVMATRRRRVVAANRIKWNMRKFMLYRKLHIRFLSRKLQTELVNFRNLAVLLIQRLTRRKIREYYMPLRVAGRNELKKKRAEKHMMFIHRVLNSAARICQKFGLEILKWNKIMKMVKVQKRKLLEWRKSKKLQRFARWVAFWCNYNRSIEQKYARDKADSIRRLESWAANRIGRNWKRRGELFTLVKRFKLRKRTLDVEARLIAEKKEADRLTAIAMEEKKKTDDFLEECINAAWKQGSDATGKNYYYNYVTGDSQWDPPDNMKCKVVDTWIKNVDARGNVYYYNQQTEESRWLPPCSVCSAEADRWCSDCQGAAFRNHFFPQQIRKLIMKFSSCLLLSPL
jgi:hypothetical protein